jgi:hypothetical protein
MKLSLEVYAEKPLWVRDDSYIRLSLRSHGLIIEEFNGEDHFSNGLFLLSGKRLSGIARSCSYSTANFPFGWESFQARPGAFIELGEQESDNLALIIQTDIILDPGFLRQMVGIRFITKNGKNYDIPLARPDIEIYWDGRGRYVIPITDFLNSKIIRVA